MSEKNINLAKNLSRQFTRTSAVEKINVANLNSKEKNDKMKELYDKIDGGWNCLACDYISSDKSSTGNIRKHVETHLDGLCYICNICSKEFSTKDTFYKHRSSHHKK